MSLDPGQSRKYLPDLPVVTNAYKRAYPDDTYISVTSGGKEYKVTPDQLAAALFPTTFFAEAAPNVLRIGNVGWLQLGLMRRRQISALNITSDTGLTASQLNGGLKPFRRYSFNYYLFVSNALAGEGIKVGLTGTALASVFVADVRITTHEATPVIVTGRLGALNTFIGMTTPNAGHLTVEINGFIQTDSTGPAAGTFAPLIGKNVALTGTACQLAIGSFAHYEDIT